MYRAILWATLVMVPSTQARLGRLPPRENSKECCPCPASGQPNNGAGTVTVTQPAQTVYVSQAEESPRQTVTVERTITAEPQTVYVTQPNGTPSNAPSGGSQVVVTVLPQPEPSQQQQQQSGGLQTVTVVNGNTQPPQQQQQQQQQPQTVTVVNGNTQPPQQQPQQQPQTGSGEQPGPSVVTKTIQPETPQQAGPQTVTINANPPAKMVSVVTVTQGEPSSEAPWSPSVFTITQGRPSSEAHSPGVVTVTASPEQPAAGSTPTTKTESPKTAAVTMQPSSLTSQQATVTAPPQVQTIIQSVDHYSTLTKTVAGGGGDNIEIVIINIYNGETSCRKKHSGKPCNAGSHQYIPPAASGSSSIPCPSVNATTSVATVYNTVLVTLPPGNGTGAAQPTGSKASVMAMGKLPRGPVSIRKW
ncbi:hypothetical protein QQS21_008083 [Conoideocrella luteorostrata]|uniref:Uncharacterized protein n=1 Tax=Conoideocrella luteorostrata TaxID=1105319 RepID=A0AAJ0FWB6_9HYPO|nr:hypothetical protein QQS21_008083 [Conoideocrella luteorostrata]